ncbi:hypothetical protein [Agaribacter flavus]|uniref:Cytochrome c domain-containing protein n=1 Tax=Agaribacter flavus TaxID=1902781 RepID=A0ABV7FVG3_9ALTE
MKRFIFMAIGFTLVFLLQACNAGDGQGLDTNGQPIDLNSTEPPSTEPEPEPEPEPEDDAVQANLASIHEKVLVPRCTQCHAGANAPLGLAMDDLDTTRTNLINVDSATNPTFKRVLPGDAENSFLYLKISGAPIAGNQMPLGEAPLDATTQETIKQWINNGAPIDRTDVVAVVKSVSQSGKNLSVDLVFSQMMDESTLTTDGIHLSDNNAGEITPDLIVIKWKNANELNLAFEGDITGYPSLQLRLNENARSSIFARNGTWLDGDRNGVEGGEFVYEISK